MGAGEYVREKVKGIKYHLLNKSIKQNSCKTKKTAELQRKEKLNLSITHFLNIFFVELFKLINSYFFVHQLTLL